MGEDGGSENGESGTEGPTGGSDAVVGMLRDGDESVYRPWAEISLLLLVGGGLLLVGITAE
ncbi:hypothetical protein BRC62_01140 [Halobacteriales archaeon QH_10_67_13]|nr:MAG: hypothetical protein BRC62_01140 [Halobacteriales archaeon QH_10_67_13]